jgi:hypothetical protein
VALRSLGFEPRKDEVKKLMSDNDKDNSGQINKKQFVEIFRGKWVSVTVSLKGVSSSCFGPCKFSCDASTCHAVVDEHKLFLLSSLFLTRESSFLSGRDRLSRPAASGLPAV